MYSGVDGRVCPPGAWSQWKNMCTDIRRCSVCDAPTSRSCGACLGVPADTYARLNEPQVCVWKMKRNFPVGRETQRRAELLGILPTRLQSRLYHVTDPREFLQ
ncbi:hypothetical protein Bca4012_099582 [Brassica carinata]|uniref:BnaC06g15430D protein n=3 Tax=Brassica TaxID=3705 RepID=A0A078F2D6_BRANA|nr:hypothetical protein HID58_071207 [Brassica napus]CAF2058704.1 unnamed protein product [Brassica napus]CDY07521.1 BnaC06g15430D [Brassica napus]VDD61968.1 unnamed protein product [Brassica oleracea]